jgi:hypothetical protein
VLTQVEIAYLLPLVIDKNSINEKLILQQLRLVLDVHGTDQEDLLHWYA